MLIRSIFVCFCLGLSLSSLAQRTPEFAGFQYSYFTSALVNDLYPSINYPDPQTFAKTKIGINQWQFFLNHPFKLSESTTLKSGIDYNLIQFNYTDFPNNLSMNEIPKSVQGLNLSLELIQKLGQGWRIHLQAQPGIASNLKVPLQSSDFIFQSYGFISKSFKENDSFLIGLGASYNTLLGEYRWLPVLDFFWQTGKFKFDGTFPFKGGAYFLPHEKFEIGFIGRVQGNHYNLNFANQASPYGYAKYNIIFGGVTARWRFYKHLTLNIESGVNANRTYELRNPTHGKLADFDPDKFNNYFLSLGFSYRMKP